MSAPVRHEAQQFEMPVLRDITDHAALVAALRSLPLPHCRALRDQAEAELLRAHPAARADLALIAAAGPGAAAAFRRIMAHDPGHPEQPRLCGRQRTLATIFHALSALASALEHRAQRDETLNPQPIT